MECVGSTLGGNVDDAAGCAAELRFEVAGLDAKVMHCIDWHKDSYAIGEDTDVFNAIQKDFGAAGALSIYIESNATRGCVLRRSTRTTCNASGIPAIGAS